MPYGRVAWILYKDSKVYGSNISIIIHCRISHRRSSRDGWPAAQDMPGTIKRQAVWQWCKSVRKVSVPTFGCWHGEFVYPQADGVGLPRNHRRPKGWYFIYNTCLIHWNLNTIAFLGYRHWRRAHLIHRNLRAVAGLGLRGRWLRARAVAAAATASRQRAAEGGERERAPHGAPLGRAAAGGGPSPPGARMTAAFRCSARHGALPVGPVKPIGRTARARRLRRAAPALGPAPFADRISPANRGELPSMPRSSGATWACSMKKPLSSARPPLDGAQAGASMRKQESRFFGLNGKGRQAPSPAMIRHRLLSRGLFGPCGARAWARAERAPRGPCRSAGKMAKPAAKWRSAGRLRHGHRQHDPHRRQEARPI